jgi:hypothetical protein
MTTEKQKKANRESQKRFREARKNAGKNLKKRRYFDNIKSINNRNRPSG